MKLERGRPDAGWALRGRWIAGVTVAVVACSSADAGPGEVGIFPGDAGLIPGLGNPNSNRFEVEVRASVGTVCPGQCSEVSARVVSGARATFGWDQGLPEGPGPHRVCPTTTTTYGVTARGEKSGGEFRGNEPTAAGAVTVVVSDSCVDGAPAGTGGSVGVDDGGTREDGGSSASPRPVACEGRFAWPPISPIDPIAMARAGIWRIAAAPDGGAVLVGTFKGTIDFGLGPLVSQGDVDAFVVRFDAACRAVWSKRYGAPGSMTIAGAVAVDAASNVLVAGAVRGAVMFDGHGATSVPLLEAAIVWKMSADGRAEWVNFSNTQPLSEVAADSGGDVLAAAGATGQLHARDGAGAAQFDALVGGGVIGSAAADSGEGWLVAGFARGDLGWQGTTVPAPANAVFFTRLDASGGHVFTHVEPPKEGESYRAIHAGPSAGAGATIGHAWTNYDARTTRIVVSGLDGAGTTVWTRETIIAPEASTAMTPLPLGGMVFGGSFARTIDWGGLTRTAGTDEMDAILQDISASGELLRTTQVGRIRLSGIAAAPTGDVWLSGLSTSGASEAVTVIKVGP